MLNGFEMTKAATKDFDRLEVVTQRRILNAVRIIVANHPTLGKNGKALKGPLAGNFRYRVADFRIIYHVADNVLIVTKIADRKDAYPD